MFIFLAQIEKSGNLSPGECVSDPAGTQLSVVSNCTIVPSSGH